MARTGSETDKSPHLCPHFHLKTKQRKPRELPQPVTRLSGFSPATYTFPRPAASGWDTTTSFSSTVKPPTHLPTPESVIQMTMVDFLLWGQLEPVLFPPGWSSFISSWSKGKEVQAGRRDGEGRRF